MPKSHSVMLRTIVFGLAIVGALALSPGDVNKQTGAARAAAHQDAIKAEMDVAKLVSPIPLGFLGEGGQDEILEGEREERGRSR